MTGTNAPCDIARILSGSVGKRFCGSPHHSHSTFAAFMTRFCSSCSGLCIVDVCSSDMRLLYHGKGTCRIHAFAYSRAMGTYFSFVSYRLEPLSKKIYFDYEIGFDDQEPLKFTEVVTLPEAPHEGSAELLERMLADVHLMLGISYYKLYCPSEIRMSRTLTKRQAEFWNTVYRKGLGEFAYRNNLDLSDRIRFPFSEDAVAPTPFYIPRGDRALVGVGGGKDSVVAIELLKEKIPCDGFVVETYATHEIADAVAGIAGIRSRKIRRSL